MKFKLTKDQWVKAGKDAGFIKEARRKDQHGRLLAYTEDYILRKKIHGLDDPYFLGGGSFHAPELVFDPKEAAIISGGKLEDMAWDWTRDWDAVPVKTPSPEVVFGLKSKTAAQIPNTQNQDPTQENFAVDMASKRRSLGANKSRINKEIHSLGNFFSTIPLSQINDILKKYSVVMLQEDGTLWSGFVTTQGDCGSDQANKQGPMQFELAVKTENGYTMANSVLVMTVCTMPSDKLEVIAYIS